MAEKIGLDITKKNIKDFVGRSLLVYAKPLPPAVEKKKGFKINVSFSWDKRQVWSGQSGYSGYSGFAGSTGFRTGSLESLDEVKFLSVSDSGECVLLEKKDWDWSGQKPRFTRSWNTVDSLLDVYFFIEFINPSYLEK